MVFINGFIDWFKGLFGKGKFNMICGGESLEVFLLYKKLAIETCISFISNIISACEFKTLENGKEVKKDTYYAFNVRPNQNQSAGDFFKELINKLMRSNQVLIIQENCNFYIADDFVQEPYTLFENVYKHVTVGEITFQRSFRENEVFYLKLNDADIKRLIDGVYTDYGKLLTAAKDSYRRHNSKRYVVKFKTAYPQNKEQQEEIENLLNRQMEAWIKSEGAGAALPMFEGKEIDDLSSNTVAASRDIRALVDDIYYLVATSFHIPVNLLKGDMADLNNNIDSLIMFCVRPIAKLLEDEVNAKYYSKAQYLRGDKLIIDTGKIKIVDISKLAIAADKLFAIGVNTIDDNLELMGRERTGENKNNIRYVTKNYQTLEGGVTSGKDENTETA